MGVDFDALINRMDGQVRRVEQQHVSALRGYIEESQRRLSERLRTGWPTNLPEESRIFREARARELLSQVNPMLQALNLGDPQSGVPDLLREELREAYDLEQRQTAELLQTYAKSANTRAQRDEIQDLSSLSSVVNLDALSAQVANAAARLTRYSGEAIESINTAVVNGLISGSGWRDVAREIRTAVYGDGGTGGAMPRGGLAFHAETIARTEMISSLQDARDQHYEQLGVDHVLWLATEDERTCEYCASKSGQIYPRDGVILPAHPRCRCVATPVKPEWLIGEDPVIAPASLRQHRDNVRENFQSAWRDAHPNREPPDFDRERISPFEKAAGWEEPLLGQSVEGFLSALSAAQEDPEPSSAPTEARPWSPPERGEHETIEEYQRRSSEVMNKKTGVFTADELKAVKAYTGDAYKPINKGLRQGKDLSDKNTKIVTDLDAAFARPEAVLQEDVALYRGVMFTHAEIHAGKGLPDDPQTMIGTIINDPGYGSTSLLRGKAAMFAGGEVSGSHSSAPAAPDSMAWQSRVVYKIQAHAGDVALPVHGNATLNAQAMQENELLLPRGTSYRVVGVDRVVDGPPPPAGSIRGMWSSPEQMYEEANSEHYRNLMASYTQVTLEIVRDPL